MQLVFASNAQKRRIPPDLRAAKGRAGLVHLLEAYANDTGLGPVLPQYLQGCRLPQQGSEHAAWLRDHRTEPRDPFHGVQLLSARHSRRRAGTPRAAREIPLDRTRRTRSEE